jgi:HlyD family secretion protein
VSKKRKRYFDRQPQLIVLSLGLIALMSGCAVDAASEAGSSQPDIIAVDVAIARPSAVASTLIYTGTTAPVKEVQLRSQIQGQLQGLTVEVGDRVRQGQILGHQDDGVLTGVVNEARAEREAQISEVASARSQVGAVSTQVEQARLTLTQAQGNVQQLQNAARARLEEARLQVQQTQADAARLTQLAKDGAISKQQAEQSRTVAQQAQQNLVNIQANSIQEITQAKTAVRTAEQVLQASGAQVNIEQGSVSAAQKRVLAQQAVLNQAQEQRSFAVLKAPLDSVVMERLAEEGNLLQVGDDVLRLGDFRQIKVIVQVPERLLSQIRVGQQTQVTLDAFANRSFTGDITRISPLANATSRLLPVEIVIANVNGRIGSGLLARVNFAQPQQRRIQVPATALQTHESRRGPPGQSNPPTGGPGQSQRGSEDRKKITPGQRLNSAEKNIAQQGTGRSRPSQSQPSPSIHDRQGTLFVLDADSSKPQVLERKVILGAHRNGQVEIIQGLRSGEAFIARSSGPLQDGVGVSPSAISESALGQE